MNTTVAVSKKIKAGVVRALNHLGYTVVRLPPRPQKTDEIVEIMVAGRSIKFHRGNPLCHVYQENPNSIVQIARASALVKESYPNAWAVDVGANVGDTLAIIQSGASLPTICVEGDPHCYALLQENAHQFESIHLFNRFLSDRPGSAFIEAQKQGWNMTLTEPTDQSRGVEIQFETLDHLTEPLNCHALIKLLKVDTEGYDLRIIRGAKTILKIAHPIITFELNRENIEPLGDNPGEFFDYLTALGYSDFLLNDPNGSRVCQIGASHRDVFLSLYASSGPQRYACYLDVWAFHRDDQQLFQKFAGQ